jgi:hypothetical protein
VGNNSEIVTFREAKLGSTPTVMDGMDLTVKQEFYKQIPPRGKFYKRRFQTRCASRKVRFRNFTLWKKEVKFPHFSVKLSVKFPKLFSETFTSKKWNFHFFVKKWGNFSEVKFVKFQRKNSSPFTKNSTPFTSKNDHKNNKSLTSAFKNAGGFPVLFSQFFFCHFSSNPRLKDLARLKSENQVDLARLKGEN